ncbi:hypothetical protein RUM43_011604 [Polyplax serrata]|uniref:Cytochrome b5 heme-binding domain-containing protein n=1 Tax=Polyplax serrata TaxID=468196 RepID=A0AAN8PUU4_POLSC
MNNRISEYSGISTSKVWREGRYFGTVDDWLEKKKKEDGAEGLWRIHDNLYDLTTWMKKHPGGSHWLEYTKGTDITEAFEINHIRGNAEKVLKKFYVRRAKGNRSYSTTFNEMGFFKTLKRKLVDRKLLDDGCTSPQQKTKILADTLAVSVFLTSLMGTFFNFWWFLLSGSLLGLLGVCSHNFFHMKDNWRMFYFHLSLMSLREWRISHVLSHHIFPNSYLDLEVSMVEPFLNFLPRTDKRIRYIAWTITPFLMMCLAHVQFIRRLYLVLIKRSTKLEWKEELVGFSFPLFIYIFNGAVSPWEIFLTWNVVVATASFVFTFIGFTAAHHHPEIYHDGDYLGNNRDFGVLQLAAVRDRSDVDGNYVLTTLMFGNHAMHHLFPTIDHSKLYDLNPVLEETCREFNINFKPMTVKNMLLGMFQQLVRNYTNFKLHIMNS